jgi:hypothetical protein
MKPENSITKNVLTEIDVEKIRRFTEAELANHSKGPLPFCYQLGTDTLIVGKYKIVKLTDKNWRITKDTEQVFDFFNRKDAIFYCIALHKNKYELAQEVRINDNLIGILEFDAILYRHRYKRAQEKNITWDIVLFSNKYTETMLRIEETKKQLKKSMVLINNIN